MIIDTALERADGVPEPDAIADHHIGNYVRKIATNLPAQA
jgi:hypothetical protein